jgi:hypothetical protein
VEAGNFMNKSGLECNFFSDDTEEPVLVAGHEQIQGLKEIISYVEDYKLRDNLNI